MKNKFSILCLVSLALTAAGVQAQEDDCETTFAYGDKKINVTPSGGGPVLKGWLMTVPDGDSFTTPIYAGVKAKKPENGTLAGLVKVAYKNDQLSVAYEMLDGFVISETTLYVSDKKAASTASGDYEKHQHPNLVRADTDSYVLDASAYAGKKLHVAALAVVCGGSGGGTDPGECDASKASWVGAWQDSIIYKAGNIVQHDGSSYINTCCESTEGVPPPVDMVPARCWELVAAKGEDGEAGPQGPTGEPGAAGPQGPTGPQGLKGEPGEPGTPGEKGADGAPGPQGERGPIGPTGPQGEKGDKGTDGKDGERGERGSTGPQGDVGVQGPTGAEGPRGLTGPMGPIGPTGPQGQKGEKGERGPTGSQGLQGLRGIAGPMGPIGPTGPQGLQGVPGICSCPSSSSVPLYASSVAPAPFVAGQCYEGDFMVGLDTDGQIVCRDAGGLCRTAFALGGTKLTDILPTTLWGWQLSVSKGETLTQPIYISAVGNDLSKAVKVGELTVKFEAQKVTVTFTMTGDAAMSATRLYVGESNVATALPENYGNAHEGLNRAVVDSYEVNVSSETVSLNIVAQAVVCDKK
uniref:hypothetical protein n=1 Tax=Candidatus Electronema sp. TaxID=2698783 RepID=UPI00405645F9